jgi:hypothetical protein
MEQQKQFEEEDGIGDTMQQRNNQLCERAMAVEDNNGGELEATAVDKMRQWWQTDVTATLAADKTYRQTRGTMMVSNR